LRNQPENSTSEVLQIIPIPGPAMANPDTLIDKLDELDRHFTETLEQMNDPQVVRDPIRIVELSKERSRLARIVEPYREYKKIRADLDEACGIVDDPGAAVDALLDRESAARPDEADMASGQGDA